MVGPHLTEVVLRLHARACQIARGVLCLLEAGFADGVMARWGTLHEVAVISMFVSAHGEEVAERYVLHQAIESRRAMNDYKKCQPRLGYEAVELGEEKAIEDAYAAVIARFGG